MAIKSVKQIGIENVKVQLFWFLPFNPRFAVVH